eukprot:TRINITY_DN9222_c0_g1_i1.p1 TRINITY_DN9222_c0_g1~~TRINITY_DN9222_c0_g1_i1.p1  ORF type:complete len:151 (-),score=39.31 TRINITY_DN9222_c0_g1_i1:26-478(-)
MTQSSKMKVDTQLYEKKIARKDEKILLLEKELSETRGKLATLKLKVEELRTLLMEAFGLAGVDTATAIEQIDTLENVLLKDGPPKPEGKGPSSAQKLEILTRLSELNVASGSAMQLPSGTTLNLTQNHFLSTPRGKIVKTIRGGGGPAPF